jgi:uncharacterized protein YhaN
LPLQEDAAVLWQNLRRRVEAAEAGAAAQAANMKRQTALDLQLVELARRADAMTRQTLVMTERLGMQSLTDAAARLQQNVRACAVAKDAAEAYQDFLAALPYHPDYNAAMPEAAIDAIDSVDTAKAQVEAQSLEATAKAQSHQVSETYAVVVQAKDRLAAVGGDEDVALLAEQRKTVLLEIEDDARRNLTLRAGIMAVEAALRRYRDTHRSSMMERASEGFEMLTGGAYAGLVARPEKDHEVLFAQAQNGALKPVETLSKGTAFQLYLALRVAGYHEFARSRAPVPFIADDIMETFDNTRAAQSFRLLAEMSKVGQVIYLTHHQHLCDIARTVCPDVTVHDLRNSGSGDKAGV